MNEIINKILCDINTLKFSLLKKIMVLFNSTVKTTDVTSLNFTGNAVDVTNTLTDVRVDINQTQSDWEEVNPDSKAFIKNKPTISSESVSYTFTGNVDVIENNPTEITINVLDTPAPVEYIKHNETISQNLIKNIPYVFEENTAYKIETLIKIDTNTSFFYFLAKFAGLTLNGVTIANTGFLKIECDLHLYESDTFFYFL